ncbi:hypothetical protein CR513_18545, partial [Mucuna pruriens]
MFYLRQGYDNSDLILNECLYGYYVHHFPLHLQLTLVDASKEYFSMHHMNSSHLRSIPSLKNMFNVMCKVLLNITKIGTTITQRDDADATYKFARSISRYFKYNTFDFIQ